MFVICERLGAWHVTEAFLLFAHIPVEGTRQTVKPVANLVLAA